MMAKIEALSGRDVGFGGVFEIWIHIGITCRASILPFTNLPLANFGTWTC